MKRFRELVIELETQGFKFSNAELTQLGPEEKFYFCEITRGLQTLNLETVLHCHLDFEMPEIIDYPRIEEGIINVPIVKPTVYFRSLYDDDHIGFEIRPEEWGTLPKKLREETDLLNKLGNYIYSDEQKEACHKIMFKPDQTFGEFYGDLVRARNLKWATINGKEIPYVTTTSDVLKNVGRSNGDLYFVAIDVAKEDWQELVVAYHERFCQSEGHRYATRKERELAEQLGYKEEHAAWRKAVRNKSKKGYFS